MIKVYMKLKTPAVPDYIFVEFPSLTHAKRQYGFQEGPKIDIADLTKIQLIEIAEEWKKELLAAALHRRVKVAGSYIKDSEDIE